MIPQTEVTRLHQYPEIEMRVIGSLISEPMQEHAEKIFRVLPTDAFTDKKHKAIYEFLKPILSKGKVSQGLILLQWAETRHCATDGKDTLPVHRQAQAMLDLGGISFNAHLFPIYLFSDVSILIEAYKHREIQEQAMSIVTDSGSIGDLSEITLKLDKIREAITDPTTEIDGLFSTDQIQETLKQIEQAGKDKTGITGLDTGYGYLNDFTAGIQKGELVLVAGRPGMGKSTFAVNMCNLISKKGGVVVWFNYESTGVELRKKLFSINSNFLYENIRKGRLEAKDWQILNRVAGEMGERKLAVLDYGNVTIEKLEGIAYAISKRYKVDLFVLDFLQLTPIGSKSILSSTENAKIEHISRTLKRIAKETGTPVMAMSQLSREVEKRSGKRPQLSDLRGSGSLEQDADLVIFPFRPAHYSELQYDENGDSLVDLAELIIAKNKNGKCGSIIFKTDLERCLFTEIGLGALTTGNARTEKKTDAPPF